MNAYIRAQDFDAYVEGNTFYQIFTKPLKMYYLIR